MLSCFTENRTKEITRGANRSVLFFFGGSKFKSTYAYCTSEDVTSCNVGAKNSIEPRDYNFRHGEPLINGLGINERILRS